jgi:hypothetical protein
LYRYGRRAEPAKRIRTQAIVDQQLAFLVVHVDQHAPTWFCKTPLSSLENLIRTQPVLALTARTRALQHCMSLIPKTKQTPESGFGIIGNLLILNNLAERVGFEFTRKRSFNNIERTAGTVKAMEDSGKQC